MTERTPWRRLWMDIEAAKIRLWDVEAKAYSEFLESLRMALEEYGKVVDPEGWDEYGLPIEAGGG